MKSILHILLATFAALMLTACPTPVDPDPITLTSNPSSLTFEAAGGTQDLMLYSGIEPSVSCSDSWVTLSPGTFSGNKMRVSVTVPAYTGTTARSTSIRVIGDKQSLMISVQQNTPQIQLSVDKTSLSFERFGGEATLTVTSSEQPSVSVDASWCGVKVGTIDNDHKTQVAVFAGANRSTAAGSGTITIQSGSDKVTVKYEGRLIDGTIFDSSYKRDPQTTTFRVNQVIRGWTEALTMMPVGSKWELYIPQELAYGSRQTGKEIKPYSTLIFVVELVDIVKD